MPAPTVSAASVPKIRLVQESVSLAPHAGSRRLAGLANPLAARHVPRVDASGAYTPILVFVDFGPIIISILARRTCGPCRNFRCERAAIDTSRRGHRGDRADSAAIRGREISNMAFCKEMALGQPVAVDETIFCLLTMFAHDGVLCAEGRKRLQRQL